MRADPSLQPLLLGTSNHPLLSIKADLYWGFDAKRGGKNQLALMCHRRFAPTAAMIMAKMILMEITWMGTITAQVLLLLRRHQ